MEPDYDVLIIGSGFGGSVSALRLTEKGYRVGVLEAGPRYADADLAKTSWNLRKFLWAPQLGMYGIQRIHLLRNVMILAGAGVGSGVSDHQQRVRSSPSENLSLREPAFTRRISPFASGSHSTCLGGCVINAEIRGRLGGRRALPAGLRDGARRRAGH